MAGAAGRPIALPDSSRRCSLAALVYWVLTLAFSLLQDRLEKRMAAKRPPDMTVVYPEPVRDPFAARGKLTPPGAEAIVRVTSLEKYFGTNHVLRGVTLEVYPRETICIIGRSGSGKSTLLRCINFLEEPTVGTVELANIRVQASTRSRPGPGATARRSARSACRPRWCSRSSTCSPT